MLSCADEAMEAVGEERWDRSGDSLREAVVVLVIVPWGDTSVVGRRGDDRVEGG